MMGVGATPTHKYRSVDCRYMRQERVQIVYMSPKDLIPYDNNPRDNDNAVPYVGDSIGTYGFINPIVVTRDHVVINGHTRLKAALQRGDREVPVIVADALDETEAQAHRLADNKTQEYSGWDFPKLEFELEDLKLKGWDMEGLGFQAIDFGALDGPPIMDNLPEEAPHIMGGTFGDDLQFGDRIVMDRCLIVIGNTPDVPTIMDDMWSVDDGALLYISDISKVRGLIEEIGGGSAERIRNGVSENIRL